jgi:hypothetical protein
VTDPVIAGLDDQRAVRVLQLVLERQEVLPGAADLRADQERQTSDQARSNTLTFLSHTRMLVLLLRPD